MSFITIITSCLLFIIIKSLLPEIISFSISTFSIAILVSISLVILYVSFQLKKEFAKAKLTKNKTYLDFIILVLASLLLLFLIDISLSKKVILPLANSTNQIFAISTNQIFAIFFLIFSIIVICLKYCTKKLDVTKLKRRFAPEASNDDNLNFKESAKEAAIAIEESEKYVSVVALNGGYGEGKSSYARMIIEAIGDEKSLYTYISLTESNATQDFSQIFANRWFETLNQRYPSINLTPYIALLETILRESTNHSAFFVAISKILVKLNFGLNKTINKCWDKNAQKEQDKFVPNSTAAMFNYITEIKEDLWIINIDEIERAQLDEIYRVIEVIERFKNEGRFGLPVKLVFLLCVSGSDLEKRLKDLKEKGFEKAQLIEDFFFNNPKSRDKNLFLPPISYEKKKEFVVNSLNNVLKNEKFGLKEIKIENIKKIDSNQNNPENKFLNQKEALSWIVDALIQKSPRVVLKICQELEFFYHHFKDSDGNYAANKVAICDAIGISFIKMEFPWLINQIKDHLQKEDEKNNIWINNSKTAITKEELDLSQSLLRLTYNIELKTKHQLDQLDELTLEKRTSNKAIMHIVLRGIFEKSKIDEIINKNLIYKTYWAQNHKKALQKLTEDELKEYLKTENFPDNCSVEKHLEIINEIVNRGSKFLKVKEVSDLTTTKTSIFDSFIFQIWKTLIAHQLQESDSDDNVTTNKICNCIKNFLKSEKILTSVKYEFLNRIFNDRDKNNDNTISLIKKFCKEQSEIKEVIKYVFIEAGKRYFNSTEIIYEKEEKPLELLWNSWNGKKNSTKNTQKINQAAIRGFGNNKKVVNEYFSNYQNKGQGKYNFLISKKQLNEISKTLEEKIKILMQNYIQYTNREVADEEYIHSDIPSFNKNIPLMMAMIEQGYIDESVSYFEEEIDDKTMQPKA